MYNRWRKEPFYAGELYHYGVKGMRWGVYKYRKHADEAAKLREIRRQRLVEANKNDPEALKLIGTKPRITLSKADKRKYADHYTKSFQELEWDINRASNSARDEHDRLVNKSSNKLQRINARYEKKQKIADRKFSNAERKANSFFSTKKSAERAFRKASKAQFKANKVAARGKNWYEYMEEAYRDAGLSMTKKDQKIGKELINRVRSNSQAMYAASYR